MKPEVFCYKLFIWKDLVEKVSYLDIHMEMCEVKSLKSFNSTKQQYDLFKRQLRKCLQTSHVM